MIYNNWAPITYDDWYDQGHEVIPCIDKKPVIKEWTKQKFQREVWKHKYHTGYQKGLKLGGKTDFDIDNHFAKRFIELLKSCGAIYGRKSNPNSHYLFLGELESYKYIMPKELEHYCKDFSHGVTLLEIRSGNSHQSIVPDSIVEDEDVKWNEKFSGIKSYPGDLKEDISVIALSTALCILYPSKGARDHYCTAIAGVLSHHTDWSESNINNFI